MQKLPSDAAELLLAPDIDIVIIANKQMAQFINHIQMFFQFVVDV